MQAFFNSDFWGGHKLDDKKFGGVLKLEGISFNDIL